MKPTRFPFIHARMATLIAAGLLPSHLHADTIRANPYDARFETGVGGTVISGPTAVGNTGLFIGRQYYGTGLVHMVVPFQLPDLGEGTFSDVTVSFYVQGIQNYEEDEEGNEIPTTLTLPSDAISVNLHLISNAPPRASAQTLATDVYGVTAASHPGDHLTRGDEVMTPFITPSSDAGWNTTPIGGPEADLLSQRINEAYSNGEHAGGFVFFRLSPTVLNPDSLTSYSQQKGLSFNTANSNLAPYLTYTFTPVSANAPVISSFTADNPIVGSGGSVTFNWNTANETSLSLNPGNINVTGLSSYTVTPSSSATYTLTAENADGTRSRSIPITVNPAIVLLDSKTANVGQNATNIVFNKPSGLSSGDVMLVAITRNANSNSASVIPPSGWTEIDQKLLRDPGNSNKTWGAVFYRVAGESEDQTYSFALNASTTPSQSNGASGILLAYSGVDVTNGFNKDGSTGGPFDVVPGTIFVNGSTTTSSVVANGITTATPNTGLVMLGMVGGNSFTWSGWKTLSPSSLAEITESRRGGSSVGAAWAMKSSSGPTGNGTATLSSSAQIPGAILLALKEGVAPPTVNSFAASLSVADPGDPVTLTWSVSNASSVSINNGIGTVSAIGSTVVTPATTTTYTITATNAQGKSTTGTTLVSVNGPGPYRYYRFNPIAVRSGTDLQLGEFQLLSNGVRKQAVTVTNPGGSRTFDSFEGALKANDNLPAFNGTTLVEVTGSNTKWFDANRKPLIYDMGVATSVNSYRLATGNDSPERDPVSWTVDGSHDGSAWIELDRQSDYALPDARNAYSLNFSLPDFTLPYVNFTSSTDAVILGQSATLRWFVQNAVSVSIDNGIGTVAASGEITVTPSSATDYVLTATNAAGGTSTKTLRVTVGVSPTFATLSNPSFQSDLNSDVAGAFHNGYLSALTGWSIIATDNTSHPASSQVAVGAQDIVPADGSQVIGLMSGAAIAQISGVRWSSLGPGDQLRLTVAAGDRATGDTVNPRWADESFFGFSDGRISKINGSTPATTGWLNNVVSKSNAIANPPGGYKSGTMGDVSFTYEVTPADYNRNGFVGIFIASLGNRDVTGNGTDIPASQSFWDNVRLEVITTPGPTINQFSSDKTQTSGEGVTLTWDVENADSISISPGIGTVPASGSIEVTPTGTTNYTLTASNSSGVKSRSIAVRVAGPAIYRYFRFTPTEVRGPNKEIVQVAEFQMLFGNLPISGATATNPGGSNPPNEWEGASSAVDGSFST
jgi:hypothetical protein